MNKNSENVLLLEKITLLFTLLKILKNETIIKRPAINTEIGQNS